MTALLLAFNLLLNPPDTSYSGKHITVIENGKTLLKGQKGTYGPQGIWRYYNADGFLLKKEKYKRGEMRWQIIYNNRGKISQSIDRKGNVKKRPDCGC